MASKVVANIVFVDLFMHKMYTQKKKNKKKIFV